MIKLVRPVVEAFFLGEQAFAEMRQEPRAALRGLAIIALVGVVVALVGLIGTTLEWATTPNMSAVKATVLEGIQDMDWYRDLRSNPEFRRQFEQWYDRGWQIFPRLFDAPDLGTAALRIITLPLGLIVILTIVLYWSMFAYAHYKWSHDDNYSHGYIVPVASAYLIWRKRNQLQKLPLRENALGLLLVALSLLGRDKERD